MLLQDSTTSPCTTKRYGCTDDTTQTLEVLALPNADITPSAVAGCTPITVTYTNSSTSVGNGVPLESFFWTFPDLATQTLTTSAATTTRTQQKEHSQLLLRCTDEFGCISSPALVNMTLTKPTADFILDSVVCDEENFIAQNTSTGATNYEWFVDGSSQAFTSNFNYSFDEVTSSAYNNVPHLITMIATDQNGCMDTATQNSLCRFLTLTFHYNLTGASVNSNGDYTCPPVFASFTDNTNSYGSISLLGLEFWRWEILNFPRPEQYLCIPRNVHCFVSIVDEFGCTADTTLIDYLTIFGPTGQASWTSVGDLCQQSFLFESDSLLNVTDIIWT